MYLILYFYSYRTLLPLIYPPHSMALGSIYVASLLLSFEQPPFPPRDGEISNNDLAEKLTTDTSWDWENIYHTKPADLEGTILLSSLPGILTIIQSLNRFCTHDP